MTPQAPAPEAPSTRALIISTGGALIVAGVILVSFVLPAEYGVDPLGAGRALGLTGISGAERPASAQGGRGPVFSQTSGYRKDAREFKLGPYEYIEFKYELDTGASMLYEWKASAPVTFNLHTDPAGKPKEASESFDKGDATAKQGAYVSPYPGLHGWYWENPGAQEVTIQLSATGFFKSAKEFHYDGTTQTYQIPDSSLVSSK